METENDKHITIGDGIYRIACTLLDSGIEWMAYVGATDLNDAMAKSNMHLRKKTKDVKECKVVEFCLLKAWEGKYELTDKWPYISGFNDSNKVAEIYKARLRKEADRKGCWFKIGI